jgi:hypothetical protein
VARSGSVRQLPSAAQASADSCFVKGDNVACIANTSEEKVTFARVKMGMLTRGAWAIHCSKGLHEFTDSGRLHQGEAYIIPIQFNAPDCTLLAAGLSKSRARVRVVLL